MLFMEESRMDQTLTPAGYLVFLACIPVGYFHNLAIILQENNIRIYIRTHSMGIHTDCFVSANLSRRKSMDFPPPSMC